MSDVDADEEKSLLMSRGTANNRLESLELSSLTLAQHETDRIQNMSDEVATTDPNNDQGGGEEEEEEAEGTDTFFITEDLGSSSTRLSSVPTNDDAKSILKKGHQPLGKLHENHEKSEMYSESFTTSYTIPARGIRSVMFSDDHIDDDEQVDVEPLISADNKRNFHSDAVNDFRSEYRRKMSRTSFRDSLLHHQAVQQRASMQSETSLLGLDEDEGCRCKISNFVLFVFVVPCAFTVWYATAILFPPEARNDVVGRFFLWTNGELKYNDEGQPRICPRASICSEGGFQIFLIAIARLTAFASYTFMTTTFVSKMHFFARWLSNSYMRKVVPFESLHEVHTIVSKIYGALIILHVLSHYIRYIARRDGDQLSSSVHVSGLLASLAMFGMIFGMSARAKKFMFCTFERRFNLHWTAMIFLCLMLCIHHPRTRIVTIVLIAMWGSDYLYGIFFATYNLEVVELLPLPDEAGVQMLWRNPKGFIPKSGEFVRIQLPWLSKGGNEWHPFSIYLKESTQKGFFSVHKIMQSNRHLSESFSGGDFVDEEGRTVLPLEQYISELLEKPLESPDLGTSFSTTGNNSLGTTMASRYVEEARMDLRGQYKTTQVFICPAGDWTKRLMKELAHQKQLRACWVRGPYTSPYSVAQNFSHLVLTATGIGITPALGVLGQYPGFSRTKIFIWSTRDKDLLKFFAPLIKDAHLSVIFYTGSEKFSASELRMISNQGNIYIQQSRPESLMKTIETIVIEFEKKLHHSVCLSIKELNMIFREAWCLFYCGGSKRIRDDLKDFSQKNGIGFESELFDW